MHNLYYICKQFIYNNITMNLSRISRSLLASTALLLGYKAQCEEITTKSDKKPLEYVQTAQFNANNPIEDRLAVFELKYYKAAVVSVFDGHGGDLCAEYASANLEQFLNARIKQNAKITETPRLNATKSLQEAYEDIENGFKAIFMQNLHDNRYLGVGSCALTAVIFSDLAVVANAGDCEGVLVGGQKIVKTNERLNAGEPSEQQRLRKEFPGESDIIKCIRDTNYCYVKGRLQPTRSFGDFYLKDSAHNYTGLKVFTGPYITHKPKITWFRFSEINPKALVIATDGLWDELDEKQISDVVTPHLKTTQMAQKLMQAAVKKILARNRVSSFDRLKQIPKRRNLHDDITIVVVDLIKFVNTKFPFFQIE